ncbi:MAG: DoxX family membrane protein [Myxococcales bacterium]|nr:DoxX family membrane protein [Myxococcota bacterium]MDW8281590.1 DoxX family membrane protein [Myxococcales bacterium]
MFDLHARLVWLLPLRLCCGWFLAISGFGKVESGWLTQPLVLGKVEAALQAGTAYRFYIPVLHQALHHGQAVSIAVALLELCAGAALLVGLVSRGAALVGFVLIANQLLLLGDASSSPLLPLGAALLALLACPSGRVLGLDALLWGTRQGLRRGARE